MDDPAGHDSPTGPSPDPLTLLLELGVEEAYALALGHFGMKDLPPLEAIENEDWGRDYLLSRLAERTDAQLHSAGLTRGDRPAQEWTRD